MTIDTCNGFDWTDEDGLALVVPEQFQVAIYKSASGAVVIRERGDALSDGDTYIAIRPEHAVAVARAILEAAGINATINTPTFALLPPPARRCPSCSTRRERRSPKGRRVATLFEAAE